MTITCRSWARQLLLTMAVVLGVGAIHASPVSSLYIAPESRTQITLSWDAPTDSATYVIYRKVAGTSDAFAWLTTLGASARSYTDSALVSGTRYAYRLVRVDAGLESAGAEGTQSTYSPPIKITAGGSYSGNWDSQDPAVYAVDIWTNDPVTIENSFIRSKNKGISKMYGSTLTVRNVYGFGINPNVAGQRKGAFVDAGNFTSVTLENNWIEGFGAGLRALNYGTAVDSNSGQSVTVRYNQVRNVDGRQSNGAGGYILNAPRGGQAFGLNSVRRGRADVAWNEIINQPFQSEGEDMISTYESGGTAASSMLIRNNYVQGGYDGNVAADIGYSGAMINLGDCPSKHIDCAYVTAYGNRVVSFSNTGVGIAGGHHMQVYNNRAVSAQRAPDGTIINSQWRVGFGFWNFYSNPNWAANLLHDNYTYVVNRDGYTVPNYVGPATPTPSGDYYNNTVIGGAYQPDAIPGLTTAGEQAEYAAWKAQLASAGVKLGPQWCVFNSAGSKICQSQTNTVPAKSVDLTPILMLLLD